MNYFEKKGMKALAAGIFVYALYSVARVVAAEPGELRRAIEERSQALQEINTQIQEVQKNLNATEEKSKSLNQEVRSFDYRISQLNLSIKASEINTEKLELELESLASDIGNKEQELGVKKEAIGLLLRQLHERDQETPLLIFLKNRSLAESIFETQSLSTFNERLGEEVDRLGRLKEELSEKFKITTDKKQSLENERRTFKARKAIAEDEKSERRQLLNATKNQERLYEQQLKELEKLQAKIAAEVEEAERELREKIDPNLIPLVRPGVLAWPAGSSLMSQGYGRTNFARLNYKGQHHNGVDIAGPIGTEIYAAEDGEVAAIGDQDRYCPRGAYGKYIVIKHTNGLTTLYAHLSRQAVAVGQKVTRGALIGYMGRSGWATGSHLHFTVWGSATFTIRASRVCGPMPIGGDLDPLNYLSRPA